MLASSIVLLMVFKVNPPAVRFDDCATAQPVAASADGFLDENMIIRVIECLVSPRMGRNARLSAKLRTAMLEKRLFRKFAGSFVERGVMSADAIFPRRRSMAPLSTSSTIGPASGVRLPAAIVWRRSRGGVGSDARQLDDRRRSARAGTDREQRRSDTCSRWRARVSRLHGDADGGCNASCGWSGPAPRSESAELSAGKVLDHLSICSAEHRVVLMLAYVDDMPIAEIAQMLGSSVSSTYSLLACMRDELRSHLTRT